MLLYEYTNISYVLIILIAILFYYRYAILRESGKISLSCNMDINVAGKFAFAVTVY